MRFAIVNGVPTEEEASCVVAVDRGLLYGDGLFETLRLYDFAPYLLDEHIERMKRSSAFLGIDLPGADWEAELRSLAKHNGHPEGAARITLTRGAGSGGPAPHSDQLPTLILQTRPLPPGHDQRRESGVGAHTLPWPLRAEGLPLQGHKTTGGYLASVMALSKVAAGEEPVLTTPFDAVSEGATSNLFWVSDGLLFTPGLSTGCLPGITRAQVLELAAEANLRVETGTYTLSQLAAADEAFLTNSVTEIAPLVSLDGVPLGNGRPGPVTRKLQDAYSGRVAEWRASTP